MKSPITRKKLESTVLKNKIGGFERLAREQWPFCVVGDGVAQVHTREAEYRALGMRRCERSSQISG